MSGFASSGWPVVENEELKSPPRAFSPFAAVDDVPEPRVDGRAGRALDSHGAGAASAQVTLEYDTRPSRPLVGGLSLADAVLSLG
jgi:hypothetical protein